MAGKGSVVISIDGDASKFEKVLSSVTGKSKRMISGIGTVAGGVAKGATLVYGAVSAAMSVAGVASIKYNASIEQLQTSFETMTGSAEKAAEIVQRLRTMGAETPFETADLAKVTQLLMQYGFEADDALAKMRMLGDIAQGNTQAMESIATGYAQMASAGKVNLQDIRQMINGGFNPLQEISERTGESMASLYDRISKGTMAVDEITESMIHATSEGGKFYQSMEKQRQTLNGQLSTLKDNLSSFGGMIFEPISDQLRDALIPDANAILTDLQRAYQSAGLDGLVNEVNRQIPRLTEAGMSAASKLFAAIGKRMPGLIKSLLSNLPTLLSTAVVDLVPQLADTVFEVASAAVEQLVGMLPQLVPTLLKGVGKLVVSVANGIDSAIAGIFSGIEQAMHQGQTKIAGIWVDDTEIAKYNFDMEIDISPATSKIETAYGEIRDALKSDLLTDDQRTEIENMIGEDYDAIKAKLMSFGLSEAEARPLATQISGASDVITAELRKLNVGADAGTIIKWMVQAKGSNVALMHYARAAGLSDVDVTAIIGVYNDANGRLNAETPSFAQTIYEALTDGLADDEATVSGLKDEVETWADGKLSEMEEGYNAALAKLDPQAPDYATRLNELNTQYEAAKTEIESIKNDSIAIVATLAGKSTESVEDAYQTIADIEGRINEIEGRISALKGEALSQAEAAFKVVRSGAKADETTISTAIKYKVTEFKLDEQSAEDAYTAAINDLNAKFANGEISKAEFETGVESATAELESAKQAAQNAFNSAFAEIMMGIAESEGNTEAVDKAMQALQTKFALAEFDTNNINPAALQGLRTQLSQLLGDAFDPEYLTSLVDLAKNGDPTALNEYIAQLTRDVDGVSTDLLTEALGGKIGEDWAAALEAGVLTGTDFDVTGTEDQLRALFSAMDMSPVGEDVTAGMGKGMANYDLTTEGERVKSNAEKALRTAFNSHSPAQTMVPIGSDVAAGVGQGMGEYDFGGDAAAMAQSAKIAASTALNGAGNSAGRMFSAGIARGILSGRSGVVNAAVSIARAAVAAIRQELEIASPSRVTTQLGRYTGLGFEQGMVESLNSAIRSAQSVVGSMNLTPRLTAPDLSSAFASAAGSIADAEGSRPIYLNVNGRTLASVTAADTRRAQNSYNRSIALGVGK